MKQYIAIAALVISIAANVPYIIEILKKQARPERMSWLIWTLLGGVYFLSTVLDNGATLYTIGELVGPITIFVLSLWHGAGGKSRFEIVSLVAAVAALSMLFMIDGVLPSLILALSVDGIAIMLTIRKLRKDPTSESRAFWALGSVSSVFALLSLKEYTLIGMMFPAYVLVVSAYIFIIAKDNKPSRPRINQPF